MNTANQTTRIRTDWRYYRKPLIISILLIPAYGFGLLLLIGILIKLTTMNYEINATGIRHGNTFLPFIEIKSVKVDDFRVLRQGNIGTLTITGKQSMLRLTGVRNASALQVAIENEVQSIKERKKLEERLHNTVSTMAAGSMERLNDLVGLWQQGLLTDEQFEEEKKKMLN